ncbi:MAG: type III pantothenate kinase [Gammaproteobacteria bacterium]
MARLLLDIGNSRLKWRFGGADGAVLARGVLAQPALPAIDGLLDAEWRNLVGVESVWMASVAANALSLAITQWIRRRWGVTVHGIRSEPERFGLVNGYRVPERLGVDRWLALLAVHVGHGGGPACIVDCGSAITVDGLDDGGRHLGGLIAPGLGMMREALLGRTHGIRPERAAAPALFGTATGEAVEGGLVQMAVGFVERSVRQMRETLGSDAPVWVTGGDGERVAEYAECVGLRVVPDLVLEGIERIAEDAS